MITNSLTVQVDSTQIRFYSEKEREPLIKAKKKHTEEKIIKYSNKTFKKHLRNMIRMKMEF